MHNSDQWYPQTSPVTQKEPGRSNKKARLSGGWALARDTAKKSFEVKFDPAVEHLVINNLLLNII